MRAPRAVRRLVARAKPAVPDRVWPLLLRSRSLLADGPLIGLPGFASVTVLAPHPDDESLGCAGTLSLLADAGCRVTVEFATDGEATRGSAAPAEVTASQRREEAVAACRVIGTAPPRFWGLADGHLSSQPDRVATCLEDALARAKPEAVFVPWFLDGHADHTALSRAVGDLLGADPGGPEIWGYETWTPLPANRLVDVTSVWPRKQEAVSAHVTAHQAFDIDAALGLNRWRTIHGLMGRGWAEGFLAAPAAKWRELCREALGDTPA